MAELLNRALYENARMRRTSEASGNVFERGHPGSLSVKLVRQCNGGVFSRFVQYAILAFMERMGLGSFAGSIDVSLRNRNCHFKLLSKMFKEDLTVSRV